MNMLSTATDAVTELLGNESYNLPWRRRARVKLGKWAEKMIKDFYNRRDKDNCDPNARNVVDIPPLDDDLERKLPDHCKPLVKPIRTLSQDARAWSEKWNSNKCGDGNVRDRKGFRQRTWKALRLVRRNAYCNLGCAERCDE